MNYMVTIIDNPDKGIDKNNILCIGLHGPERCKHLLGDTPGQFSCAVHDRPWYKDTPCYHHGQFEAHNSNCRIGEYILTKIKEGI